jgi:hypothetical protein
VHHIRGEEGSKFYSENLKRTLGSHRRRWEDNIKMYLDEMEYEYLEWINLAQGKSDKNVIKFIA